MGMKAYVLITAEVGKSPAIQEELRAKGIQQVDAVAGTYDLVAVVEADDPKSLGDIVMGTIQRTPGVINTVTLLAIG
ncbi:MAG: AsnC family transcriptional regulator [Chloroflexota bacterium]